MASAETGSGKTAAYLLPLISNILLEGQVETPVTTKVHPRVMVSPNCCKKKTGFDYSYILVPTRELAIQIWEEATKVYLLLRVK